MNLPLEAITDMPHFPGGHDAPVTHRDQDDLERWPIARAIHRVIATTPHGWATRIGLYGRWGTGKTSVLNFLEDLEKQAGNLVVRFSAWSAVGEAGVIALLYESLDAKLSESGVVVPASSWLKKTVLRFGRASQQFGTDAAASGAADALLPGSGAAVTAAVNFTLSKLNFDKSDLDALLMLTRAAGFKRIVIFIDDLDRADPKVLPKSLLALRELLDWPDFAFVLAFDKSVVAKSLGEYSSAFGESADLFLEKIIDMPFDLPAPTSPQVKRVAKRALDECCDFIPLESRTRISEWFPSNPRTAKLVARSLGALRTVAVRHDPEEIDWYALGVQTTLRLLSRTISDEVERSMLGIGADFEDGWGLQSKDSPDPHEVVKSMVERLTLADAGHAEKRRLVQLVEAVKRARVAHPEARINYEMSLLVDEPPFTWREYRVLVADWLLIPADATIQRDLVKACLRSGKNLAEAASDLLQSAIEGYGETLERLSEVHDMVEYTGILHESTQRLSFLEWLCRECRLAEVESAARSTRHSIAMFNLFSQWSHFNLNEGDRLLRDRELALLVLLGDLCAEPMHLYHATEPTIPRTRAEIRHSSDTYGSWINSVRHPLEARVLEQTIAWFYESGRVGRSASTIDHGSLEVWLIESPDSPLYRDTSNSLKLRAVFEDASRFPLQEKSSNVRGNALIYCHRLLEGRENGAWLTMEQRPTFFAKHKDLVSAAWDAIVAVQPQQRSLALVKDLHNKLVENGLSSDQLKTPRWFDTDRMLAPKGLD